MPVFAIPGNECAFQMQDSRRIEWAGQLAAIGAEHGFYEELDAEHKALFLRGNGTLVVTFDNLDDARQKPEDRLPWGVRFIAGQGWSALGISAHGWTWYRSEKVFDFFDRLRDEGFFDGFERVVFYGASMAGYAALAFSAAAPGATVIALSPQATLDRSVTACWETRYRAAWRRDFSGRYGYAPDQIGAARKVWVIFDPCMGQDAMHAALIRGPNVSHIRARHMGHNMGTALSMIGALKPLVTACIDGSATPARLYALLRARRTSSWYQKQMLAIVLAGKRARRIRDYAQAVVNASHPKVRPHFQNAAAAAAAALGATK